MEVTPHLIVLEQVVEVLVNLVREMVLVLVEQVEQELQLL